MKPILILSALLTLACLVGVANAQTKPGDIVAVASGTKDLKTLVTAIKVVGAAVTVDKAKVSKTDVSASNGVIHIIDTVLLP